MILKRDTSDPGAPWSYSISGYGGDEQKLLDAFVAAAEKSGGTLASFVATGGEINASDIDEAREKATKAPKAQSSAKAKGDDE